MIMYNVTLIDLFGPFNNLRIGDLFHFRGILLAKIGEDNATEVRPRAGYVVMTGFRGTTVGRVAIRPSEPVPARSLWQRLRDLLGRTPYPTPEATVTGRPVDAAGLRAIGSQLEVAADLMEKGLLKYAAGGLVIGPLPNRDDGLRLSGEIHLEETR